MTNEEFVRQAYASAELKDLPAWAACFNADGVFVDESVGVTYRGPILGQLGVLGNLDAVLQQHATV
jgi:ketosteroid isomerase-like protein